MPSLPRKTFQYMPQQTCLFYLGAQIVIDAHIYFDLPSKIFLEPYCPEGKTKRNPHLCPGIINSAHVSSVQVLVVNLNAVLMKVQKGQLLGYVKILKAADILSLYPFSGDKELNLPSVNPVINVLFSNADFTHLPVDWKYQALAILDQFSDIFVEGTHDFVLEKSVIYQIETGDAPLSEPSRIKKSNSRRNLHPKR